MMEKVGALNDAKMPLLLFLAVIGGIYLGSSPRRKRRPWAPSPAS